MMAVQVFVLMVRERWCEETVVSDDSELMQPWGADGPTTGYVPMNAFRSKQSGTLTSNEVGKAENMDIQWAQPVANLES